MSRLDIGIGKMIPRKHYYDEAWHKSSIMSDGGEQEQWKAFYSSADSLFELLTLLRDQRPRSTARDFLVGHRGCQV